MRKYIVTVNGKKYEVEVEEVGAAASAPAAVGNNAVKEEVKREEIKQETAAARPTGGRITVKAPMPGTILDIKISKGQSVKKGDVMFILEAMKMENEIMAGEDGVVVDIAVTKGTAVNTDDILATLD
jgi:biotin carboxyl carrier protein